MDEIFGYFPYLASEQQAQFIRMGDLYRHWNERINVISRQDTDQLYIRHILHSLAIARVVSFHPGTRILDVGCGGGFPGIPLAVLFPESRFTLVDSIGKKIGVVRSVAEGLGLRNVDARQVRAEDISGKFDFVVNRAVTQMPRLVEWVWDKITPGGTNVLPNGILSLKGGDLTEELAAAGKPCVLFDIADFFDDPFFETKKIVYLFR
ncbi:MAG: 16S rRNA (guanine(527)-N(7))-methyltransferase RsmG [Rikenellaceae bacterium]|jgi:16S rRNA (guanine527-N7)-methyltransferase|nr:16S rRNA (guanine(527)-N(7))-methyltransferase RsmG [Rikenellaceae bacterium]